LRQYDVGVIGSLHAGLLTSTFPDQKCYFWKKIYCKNFQVRPKV